MGDQKWLTEDELPPPARGGNHNSPVNKGTGIRAEKRICQRCSNEFDFMPYPSAIARGYGRYCSKQCSKNIEIRICQGCGNPFEFHPAPSNIAKDYGKFCSKQCRGGNKQFACQKCGIIFIRNHGNTSFKYCSTKCAGVSDGKKVTIYCEVCGTSFERLASKQAYLPRRFCSLKCNGIAKRKSWQNYRRFGRNEWKGPEGVRQAILKRDYYTCQRCKKRGGHLHVHHIKSWKQCRRERIDPNDPSNLTTLCGSCHMIVEPRGNPPN